MPKLQRNLIYSLLLTLSTYLVPLVVFPYISRVLGPAGMGSIEFVDNVIDFAILFSMMGLTTLGVREIAKNRDSRERLDRTFSELFALNLISTVLVLCLLLVLLFLVPEFRGHSSLFFVGLTKIVFNLLWIEWFFKGIENFRYITIRSVLVRLAFIVSVFLFVRTKDDAVVYYALWVGITVANAFCNWSYRRRYVSLVFRHLCIARYVKPFVFLGLFALLSAVYTHLNVVYLSFVSTDAEVGYFTTATKLYRIMIALFSALTSVMIPHMSVLVKQHDVEEMRRLTGKVFQLLFSFAFPVLIFIEVFADDLILLFAGDQFADAALPMRMVILLLLVIGTEQILVLQLLIPMRKDRDILLSACVGVAACVAVNLLLTVRLGSTGAALSWMSAEVAVMLCAFGAVRRYVDIHFPFRLFLRQACCSLPYLLAAVAVWMLCPGLWRLLVAGVLFCIYAVWLFNRTFDIHLLRKVKERLR